MAGAEIIEYHHPAKLDAPSGTAARTARADGRRRADPLRPPAGHRRRPGRDPRRRRPDADHPPRHHRPHELHARRAARGPPRGRAARVPGGRARAAAVASASSAPLVAVTDHASSATSSAVRGALDPRAGDRRRGCRRAWAAGRRVERTEPAAAARRAAARLGLRARRRRDLGSCCLLRTARAASCSSSRCGRTARTARCRGASPTRLKDRRAVGVEHRLGGDRAATSLPMDKAEEDGRAGAGQARRRVAGPDQRRQRSASAQQH